MSARGCSFKMYILLSNDLIVDEVSKNLLDEIELLHKKWGITYIAFQDDLLMSS